MDKIPALVIDDSSVMRLMVMRSLRQTRLAEFEFDEAEDGEAGLEKIKAGQYRMVFVDINMPRLDGISMVRQVREAGFDDLAIVMITSEKTVARVNEALENAGANAYIEKPFTVDRLEDQLAELIAAVQRGADAPGGLFARLVKG